ncbi:BPI fold-containing family B member 3-like [Sphaerodactylus townsendi]|uniref:BPI fold-containing family B member 3-like n=1 Tax=Sphaerodactylus townsendi TaxID=933632 RepID=UPI0020272F0D|nr:BPI fold-containing family B member 3-like [Sphaerodactylus townsendi]
MVRDASGAPRLVVQNCKTLMSGVKLKSELLKPLDGVVGNLLNNLLPGVLCPVIELVVNVLNTLLGTINSICPFGVLGQLHYTLAGLPVFQDQHILLNLNLMITDLEGKKTINLPPVRLPVLPEPAAGDHVSQLVLPGELISTLIGSLGSKGLLNADITQQTLRGNVPMTTSALQSLIPAISLLGVPSLPLVVRIRLNELPRVSLQNGEVFVSLATSIEVLAHTRFGSKQLFELAATVGLSGKITPGLAKLSITLSLKSLNLRVASSVLGSINVGVLQGWITNLLVSEYLPILNGALEIGIPLPKLFNLNFDDAAVSVVQNALVVGTTPKLH